ncbi:peptide chain release factor N(5)-glutamine methyltransferase [Candidatus Thiosymbion oneisti]|uniref:peptide chain release factor N(5)-glutamine methyltransferase n=1 Tax=Candidatus Thiosymbion oneisti TaxID=589554 RepID=UPI000A56FD6D|nr:peptide chain release factor N(5)-glutamine methyltransferase [Candidatus Thiosymbion oneisti]
MSTGSRHTDDAQRRPSIGRVLREATAALAALPQASPHLEAALLLCDATGHTRTELLAWPEAELGEADLARFEALIQRRLAGEPMAHIRGHQAFWTLDLEVTPDTLIPRPETELLVELALERLRADAPILVLDAGSGSGAIAAALASERPAWTLIATDQDMGAARMAGRNFRTYALRNVHVVSCDWLAPIAERSLDAIVGNPPYLPAADPHLRQGDLPWEPRRALAAGPDGLDAIRILGAQAASRLRPDGFIALEHGFDQGPAVRMIFNQHGFEDIRTHPDFGGRERVTTGRLPV